MTDMDVKNLTNREFDELMSALDNYDLKGLQHIRGQLEVDYLSGEVLHRYIRAIRLINSHIEERLKK
jgi:hypothetical protein